VSARRLWLPCTVPPSTRGHGSEALARTKPARRLHLEVIAAEREVRHIDHGPCGVLLNAPIVPVVPLTVAYDVGPMPVMLTLEQSCGAWRLHRRPRIPARLRPLHVVRGHAEAQPRRLLLEHRPIHCQTMLRLRNHLQAVIDPGEHVSGASPICHSVN